ncbi:hypothetical protein [Larkinella terrae]|uniref:Uncharacterized protein n=1 Tax=Larkinella terrae TaxID=2025311 RepID=A0A7K0EIK6_9BACT|nr:hypothetical protein [Larkinella terrae]MRS61288.1 hypothetical protein [Larkinella terrae]
MHEDIAQCFMDYAERFQTGKNDEKRPYSRRHLDRITSAVGDFFDTHPHLLTNDVIELIAVGDEAEKQARFGHLNEFHSLNDAVVTYFNSLQPRSKKAYGFGFLRNLVRWNRPQVAPKMSYNSTVNS